MCVRQIKRHAQNMSSNPHLHFVFSKYVTRSIGIRRRERATIGVGFAWRRSAVFLFALYTISETSPSFVYDNSCDSRPNAPRSSASLEKVGTHLALMACPLALELGSWIEGQRAKTPWVSTLACSLTLVRETADTEMNRVQRQENIQKG